MTEKKAIKTIQKRIDEMTADPIVQKTITEKYLKSMSKQECRRMIAKIAIATLFGSIKKRKS